MNFYTFKYIQEHQTSNRLTLYTLMVIAGITLIVFGTLYLRNRMSTRYRDFGIIALLFFMLFAGVQYEKVEQTNIQKSQANQIIPFIKSVAKDKNVTPDKVMVSSTSLVNGLIVRVRDIDYQLNLNNDNNSYTLTRAHVIDHHVYVKK